MKRLKLPIKRKVIYYVAGASYIIGAFNLIIGNIRLGLFIILFVFIATLIQNYILNEQKAIL